MQTTISYEEDHVYVSGYKFRWNISTFLRLLLFVGSIIIVSFLLNNAKEATSKYVLIAAILVVLLFAILLHTKTKIQFSIEKIRVTYGWLPFVRERKTKNLKSVYIEYSDANNNDSPGGEFTYLVLDFSNEGNIKIFIDQLARKEREQVTSRLSYLRHKFSDEQYNIPK